MTYRVGTIAALIAVFTASVTAGPRPGGIARQLALGGSGYSPLSTGPNIILNPFIHDDPAVELLNPAYQNMYRDYAWLNVAGGAVSGFNSTVDNGYGKQFAGVAFGLNRELALGVNLSFDPSFTSTPGVGVVPQLASYVNLVSGRAAQVGLAPIDVFEAVGSYDLGQLDLGFGFLYGWATNTSKTSASPAGTSTDNELSARVLGFRFGAIVNLGGGNSFDADAAIRLDKATDKLSTSPVPAAPLGEYSASATEIQIDARLKLKMSNRVNFVPYASFVTISGEPKQDTPPTAAAVGVPITTRKFTAMLLAVGAGMEYKINNFYFAGGVSFKTANAEGEQSTPPPTTTSKTTITGTGFPVINMGLEWTLLDWLTGRMGYYRSFLSVNNKTEASSATASSTSETDTWFGNSNVVFGSLAGSDNGLITLGLGLKFGNFALDGTVSEEALRRGLGLVGSQDAINTFGYVTASYSIE
jgi:hypothetical protein